MTTKADVTARVQRLLTGRSNARDLDFIFTWLRFRSFGHFLVRDIGDFATHMETRTKGESWKGIDRLMSQLTFRWARLVADRFGSSNWDVKTLKDATLASIDTMPAGDVKTRTGMGKEKARKSLKAVLDKILTVKNGHVTIHYTATDQEIKLFIEFSNTTSIYPTFTALAVTVDLGRALLKNEVISRTDYVRLLSLENLIGVYVCEKMHGATVSMENGRIARLYADVDEDDAPVLCVKADIDVDALNTFATNTACVFLTNASPDEWTEGDWRSDRTMRGIPLKTIELSGAGKLRPIL